MKGVEEKYQDKPKAQKFLQSWKQKNIQRLDKRYAEDSSDLQSNTQRAWKEKVYFWIRAYILEKKIHPNKTLDTVRLLELLGSMTGHFDPKDDATIKQAFKRAIK